MDGSRSTGEAQAGLVRPPRPGTRRARARWVAGALMVSAALGAAGRQAAPRVRLAIRLRLAERAIAGGRLDEAEARLLPLIEEGPMQARPRLLWAGLARRRGQITEAEEALQRAVELGLPIQEGRREHALILAGQDFGKAEGTLRHHLDDQPDDAEVHRALAEGYARLDRWEPAIDAYAGWSRHATGQDKADALLGLARAAQQQRKSGQ
jgi:predicted Zn-dependent protease